MITSRQQRIDGSGSRYDRWISATLSSICGHVQEFTVTGPCVGLPEQRSIRLNAALGVVTGGRQTDETVLPDVAADGEPQRIEQFPLDVIFKRRPGHVLDDALQIQKPFA